MELGHSQTEPRANLGRAARAGNGWGQRLGVTNVLGPLPALCMPPRAQSSLLSLWHLPVSNAFHRRWPCPTRPGLSPGPARSARLRWTLLLSLAGSLRPAQLPASSASCPELCAAPRASPQHSPAGSGPTALLSPGGSGQWPHGLSPCQGHSSSCSSERTQPQPWARCLAKAKGGSLGALLPCP